MGELTNQLNVQCCLVSQFGFCNIHTNRGYTPQVSYIRNVPPGQGYGFFELYWSENLGQGF